MNIADRFILLTVDEDRADKVNDDQSVYELEYAVDLFAEMVHERNFSAATSLSSAAAVDQYGNKYTAVKVLPNVVFEHEGSVYVGSDGFFINLSDTLDYITRRLNKLKAEQ